MLGAQAVAVLHLRPTIDHDRRSSAPGRASHEGGAGVQRLRWQGHLATCAETARHVRNGTSGCSKAISLASISWIEQCINRTPGVRWQGDEYRMWPTVSFSFPPYNQSLQ